MAKSCRRCCFEILWMALASLPPRSVTKNCWFLQAEPENHRSGTRTKSDLQTSQPTRRLSLWGQYPNILLPANPTRNLSDRWPKANKQLSGRCLALPLTALTALTRHKSWPHKWSSLRSQPHETRESWRFMKHGPTRITRVSYWLLMWLYDYIRLHYTTLLFRSDKKWTLWFWLSS